MLRRFYLGMKVIARYIDPTGIKNQSNYIKRSSTFNLLVPKIEKKPRYKYMNNVKKKDNTNIG